MLSKSIQRRMAAQGNPVMKCRYCGTTVLLHTLHHCQKEGKILRASSDRADFLVPIVTDIVDAVASMAGESWAEPAPINDTPFAGGGGSFGGAGATGSWSDSTDSAVSVVDSGGSGNDG